MQNIFWNPIVRIVLFWTVVVASFWLAATLIPSFQPSYLAQGLQNARTDWGALSAPEFVHALATSIVVFAAALAVAFTLLHALSLSLSLYSVSRRLAAPKTMVAFADEYGAIHKKLEQHPLIGHAWKEFDETLVMPAEEGQPIRNTVRPQAFINTGVLREKLFGLKMMGSIPGYFVGIGLLLTFVGLVLALHKASAAVSSTDASGMQAATRELLQVASFKFATSIAGLFASIALSLLFRIYTITIEGSLDSICHIAEQKLRYTAPQSITAEMNDRLGEQVSELKQINSADFFSRMGEQLSPQIQSAFATAMAPMSHQISDAVAQLSKTSQSGASDLIKQFTDNIHGSAGSEIHELGKTLIGIREALSATGDNLQRSSDNSRAALADVMLALQGTFERANQAVKDSLDNTASTASVRIEEMLSATFGRLESQVTAFQASLAQYQSGMGGHLDETSKKVAESRAAAVDAIGSASVEAAQALKAGLGQALEQINGEVGQLASAMREASLSVVAQNNALRDTTDQSRAIADAFGRTAQEVRTAAAPLLQTGERIAGATERLSVSFKSSIDALEAGQASSRQLAEALQSHATQMSSVWANYSGRFEKVDADLARAFEQISAATVEHGDTLASYTSKVDEGLAKAVDRLHPLLVDLNDEVEHLAGAIRAKPELIS